MKTSRPSCAVRHPTSFATQSGRERRIRNGRGHPSRHNQRQQFLPTPNLFPVMLVALYVDRLDVGRARVLHGGKRAMKDCGGSDDEAGSDHDGSRYVGCSGVVCHGPQWPSLTLKVLAFAFQWTTCVPARVEECRSFWCVKVRVMLRRFAPSSSIGTEEGIESSSFLDARRDMRETGRVGRKSSGSKCREEDVDAVGVVG